jgi:purine-binding chemotaxis protein CheW
VKVERALVETAAGSDVVTVEVETLIVVVRIGERRFGLPADAVRRIVPMAALTPLPDAPAGIAGFLAFGGEPLPVVDPRAQLGIPPTVPQPSQHLVALGSTSRFLLWVDRAEAVGALPSQDLAAVDAAAGGLAQQLARLGDEYLPVLSPDALDPGPLLRRGAREDRR